MYPIIESNLKMKIKFNDNKVEKASITNIAPTTVRLFFNYYTSWELEPKSLVCMT